MKFETYVVNTEHYIRFFINAFVHGLVYLVVVYCILGLIFFILTKHKGAIICGSLFIDAYIAAFKIMLSFIIFRAVFFYDFNLQIYTYQIPEKMILSNLFVGILAFYEILTNILQIIKIVISIPNAAVPKQ